MSTLATMARRREAMADALDYPPSCEVCGSDCTMTAPGDGFEEGPTWACLECVAKPIVVVWFSCGAASAVAAKLAVDTLSDRYEVRVVNTPVDEEDEDNRRFLGDVETWIGQPIEIATNPDFPSQSAVDVWEARRYMSGVAGAPCTQILKKGARYAYEDAHEIAYHVLGFTADETHRHERFTLTERSNVLPLLIEAGYTKTDCARVLMDAGIDLPRIYEHLANANCFTGRTTFVTSDGPRAFADAVGETVQVVTRAGLANAIVRSFGEQEIVDLTVERNGVRETIETTAGHAWIAPRYRSMAQGEVILSTVDLPIGKTLPAGYVLSENAAGETLDEDGIRHGFVFGDGSLYNTERQPIARANIVREKSCMLRFFSGYKLAGNERVRTVHGLPAEWKMLPSPLAGRTYMLGFIAGLIASDGCAVKGGVSISNESPETAEAIADICRSQGLYVASVKHATRDTNYKKGARLSTVLLSSAALRPEWLLRPFHQERFSAKTTRPKGYRVVSIRPTGRVEPVYCVTVPEHHEFTLGNGLLTRNCWGCVKAESPTYWNTVRRIRPDVFEARATQSRDIGARLVKWRGERLFLDELPTHAMGRPLNTLDFSCGLFCEEHAPEPDCEVA